MKLHAGLLPALVLAACGTGFQVTTPQGFADLTDVADQAPYDYRATSADGVVLAIRRLDREPRQAEPDFWLEAILERMRQRGGYALLERASITTAQGLSGTRLRFGRDQDGKPYLYELVLFVQPKHLYLIETGGAKDTYEKRAAAVQSSVTALRLDP